jgi:hypothetical protein
VTASDRSCVTKTIVIPVSDRSRSSSSCSTNLSCASSAPNALFDPSRSARIIGMC